MRNGRHHPGASPLGHSTQLNKNARATATGVGILRADRRESPHTPIWSLCARSATAITIVVRRSDTRRAGLPEQHPRPAAWVLDTRAHVAGVRMPAASSWDLVRSLSLISVLVLPRTVIRFRRPSGFQPTVIVPVQRSSRDGP